MEAEYSDLRSKQEVDAAYKEVAEMFTNAQAVSKLTKEMMVRGHREFEVCQLSRLLFNTCL